MARAVQLVIGLASLIAWSMMFLAGHDVWHELGSPDFWHLNRPPFFDLRIFASAFYASFVLILAQLAWSTRAILRGQGDPT
jgi:hypothetical protein